MGHRGEGGGARRRRRGVERGGVRKGVVLLDGRRRPIGWADALEVGVHDRGVLAAAAVPGVGSDPPHRPVAPQVVVPPASIGACDRGVVPERP